MAKYFSEQDSVLIDNPHFQDFQFRQRGIVNKLDEVRERFLFECRVTDSYTSATGKIQSLVIFRTLDKTTYFESLTLHLEAPEKKRYKIVELSIDDDEEEVYPIDTPSKYDRTRSGYH